MSELTVGMKYDTGKLRWDLVPPEFEEVVKVLTYGATKYDDRNWELGINYGRLIAAAQRHIWAWVRGERDDPETGIHHLAHAACDIMFLLTYEKRNMNAFDDRAHTKRDRQPLLASSGIGLQPNIPPSPVPYTGQQLDSSYGVTPSDQKASDRQDQKPRVIDGGGDEYIAPWF